MHEVPCGHRQPARRGRAAPPPRWGIRRPGWDWRTASFLLDAGITHALYSNSGTTGRGPPTRAGYRIALPRVPHPAPSRPVRGRMGLGTCLNVVCVHREAHPGKTQHARRLCNRSDDRVGRAARPVEIRRSGTCRCAPARPSPRPPTPHPAAHVGVDIVPNHDDVGRGESHRIGGAREERGARLAGYRRRLPGRVLQCRHERPRVEGQAVRGLPVTVLLHGDQPRATVHLPEGAVQPVEGSIPGRRSPTTTASGVSSSTVKSENSRRVSPAMWKATLRAPAASQQDRSRARCRDDVGDGRFDAERRQTFCERTSRTPCRVRREPQRETAPADGIDRRARTGNPATRLVDGPVQVEQHAPHAGQAPGVRHGGPPGRGFPDSETRTVGAARAACHESSRAR